MAFIDGTAVNVALPQTAAGSAFVPFVVITFLISRWAGGLVTRYGARLPLVIGPIIVAVGFALFAIPGT